MSNNAALLAFVDALRGKGVRTYKGPFEEGTIEIELGPALIPDAPQTATEKDKSLCGCGCPVYAHTNGLCLAGCEPEKCVEASE